MITEDYVSFEVAKLLKEKEFEILTSKVYDNQKELDYQYVVCWQEKRLPYVSAPTYQMAMKWLREVHHIAINIGWGEIFEDRYRWWYIILNMDNGNILGEDNHASYEQAVEEAIKYCLENLI